MPLHKCMSTIWCALSDQCGSGWGGGRGSMRSVRFQESSSKTVTIGIALMLHKAHNFRRCAQEKHDKICVLRHLSKTSCLSETVRDNKIDERAFQVALDFLLCKRCSAGDSQIFEHPDLASKSLANFLTG